MKRVLCFVLALLMMVPQMVFAASAETAIPEIELVSEGGGAIGEIATVTLKGKNLPGCASMDLLVSYDTEALKPVANSCVKSANSIIAGMMLANTEGVVEETHGVGHVGEPVVRIAAITTSQNDCLAGTGDLLEMKFEVLKETAEPGAMVKILKQEFSLNTEEIEILKGLDVVNTHVNVPVAEGKTVASLEWVQYPAKTKYEKGEALDISDALLKVTYADTTTAAVDPAMVKVSGYDRYAEGKQTVTLSYAGKSVSFDINDISVALETVELLSAPTKLTYVQGQELDPEGGRIKLTYEDTSSVEKPLSEAVVSGYDKNQLGTQQLTVSYNGIQAATGFTVEVIERKVVSIEITTLPARLTYFCGQEVSLAGGELTLTYNDDSTEPLAMTAEGVSIFGYNNEVAGEQMVTVEYLECTDRFSVEYIAVAVTEIAIANLPDKLTYVEGQALNLAGGSLNVFYNDGTDGGVLMTDAAVSVSGYDPATLGTQQLTVSFGGAEANFEVTVVAKELASIAIGELPTKLSYNVGEALSLNGGTLTLTYNDNSTLPLAMTAEGVTAEGYNATQLGTQTITVSYQGKTATFDVVVLSNEKPVVLKVSGGKAMVGKTVSLEVSLADAPASAGYQAILTYDPALLTPISWDSALDSALGSYSFDVPGEIRLIEGDVSKIIEGECALGTLVFEIKAMPAEGEISLGVKEGKLADELGEEMLPMEFEAAPIRVIELSSIELSALPAKLTYLKGEALDLTGAALKLIYSDNSNEPLPITAEGVTVEGYDANLAGTQTITVVYQGKSATFEVEVLSNDQLAILKVSGGEGVVGSTVSVTVSVANASASAGYQAILTYDPALLTPISWDSALDSALGSYSFDIPGEIRLIEGDLTTILNEDCTLGTLVFKVKAMPASGKVTLGVKESKISNANGDGMLPMEFEAAPISIYKKNPFKDVKSNEYFYIPVLWAVSSEITTGTDATHFSPNEDCTRAQVVTFLWRAAGKPEPTTNRNPFKDVGSNMYYYKAVLWAVENGITTGTSSKTFEPDAVCSRGQIVTFLWRAAGEPAPTSTKNPFKDVKSDAYYYTAVLWAVEKGITNGTAPKIFGPDDTCIRAQVVTFLYRYVKGEE